MVKLFGVESGATPLGEKESGVGNSPTPLELLTNFSYFSAGR